MPQPPTQAHLISNCGIRGMVRSAHGGTRSPQVSTLGPTLNPYWSWVSAGRSSCLNERQMEAQLSARAKALMCQLHPGPLACRHSFPHGQGRLGMDFAPWVSETPAGLALSWHPAQTQARSSLCLMVPPFPAVICILAPSLPWALPNPILGRILALVCGSHVPSPHPYVYL